MAVNNYGWDVVYAMRFNAVNAKLLESFTEENSKKKTVQGAIALERFK